MEAVPRMPMLSFELKQSLEFVEFGPALKQYIRDQYGEDPAVYNKSCNELDQLRQTAVHVSHDFMGCSTLKKYYSQLQFLQGRFPLGEMGDAAVAFTWEDVHSGREVTRADIKFEQACILYNIGALHSILGAMDTRQSADGMKVSCTHFQCAAWAFEFLKDHFDCDSMLSEDLALEMLSFQVYLMLAQAQECILEKSMADSRKSTITAKVSAQIVEFYRGSLKDLEKANQHDLISSKRYKDWKKKIDMKVLFYTCITHFYMGCQAEDQQKWGLCLAYFTLAQEKLTECTKVAKGESSDVLEALRFTNDVVGGKYQAAKKDNDFVYHDKIPANDSLPEVKGASLVKGIQFNANDPEISGPDIFQKLVPMAAHEASSLYSEEKANLLRRMTSEIAEKNDNLNKYLASLQLDQAKLNPEPERLPQALLEKCAALSVRQNAIKDLVDSMSAVSSVSTEVDMGIREIQELLQSESAAELEFQEKFGARATNVILTEIAQECARLEEGHKKGSQSNSDLHRAMNTHITNLRLLSSPLDELQKALPSLDKDKDPESVEITKQLNMLLTKIEEMRSQRESLEEQFRKGIMEDDITGALCKQEGVNRETLFQDQLKKHDQTVTYIRQNLGAQENILRAVTDANAKYATVRMASNETIQRREQMIQDLINSYDVYEELMAKSQRGLEFYKKLETNVGRLLARCKAVCKVQHEEREQVYNRAKPKAPAPSRPTVAKPDIRPAGTPSPQGGVSPGMGGVSPGMGGVPSGMGGVSPGMGGVSPNMGGVSSGMGGVSPAGGVATLPPGVQSHPSVTGMFDGPKLKDYLPFMKPKTFGKKDDTPPMTSADPMVQDYINRHSSLPPSGSASPIHLPQMAGSVPASPDHFRNRVTTRLPDAAMAPHPDLGVGPDLTQGHPRHPGTPTEVGQLPRGHQGSLDPRLPQDARLVQGQGLPQVPQQRGHDQRMHSPGIPPQGQRSMPMDSPSPNQQAPTPPPQQSEYVPLDQKWKRDGATRQDHGAYMPPGQGQTVSNASVRQGSHSPMSQPGMTQIPAVQGQPQQTSQMQQPHPAGQPQCHGQPQGQQQGLPQGQGQVQSYPYVSQAMSQTQIQAHTPSAYVPSPGSVPQQQLPGQQASHYYGNQGNMSVPDPGVQHPHSHHHTVTHPAPDPGHIHQMHGQPGQQYRQRGVTNTVTAVETPVISPGKEEDNSFAQGHNQMLYTQFPGQIAPGQGQTVPGQGQMIQGQGQIIQGQGQHVSMGSSYQPQPLPQVSTPHQLPQQSVPLHPGSHEPGPQQSVLQQPMPKQQQFYQSPAGPGQSQPGAPQSQTYNQQPQQFGSSSPQIPIQPGARSASPHMYGSVPHQSPRLPHPQPVQARLPSQIPSASQPQPTQPVQGIQQYHPQGYPQMGQQQIYPQQQFQQQQQANMASQHPPPKSAAISQQQPAVYSQPQAYQSQQPATLTQPQSVFPQQLQQQPGQSQHLPTSAIQPVHAQQQSPVISQNQPLYTGHQPVYQQQPHQYPNQSVQQPNMTGAAQGIPQQTSQQCRPAVPTQQQTGQQQQQQRVPAGQANIRGPHQSVPQQGPGQMSQFPSTAQSHYLPGQGQTGPRFTTPTTTIVQPPPYLSQDHLPGPGQTSVPSQGSYHGHGYQAPFSQGPGQQPQQLGQPNYGMQRPPAPLYLETDKNRQINQAEGHVAQVPVQQQQSLYPGQQPTPAGYGHPNVQQQPVSGHPNVPHPVLPGQQIHPQAVFPGQQVVQGQGQTPAVYPGASVPQQPILQPEILKPIPASTGQGQPSDQSQGQKLEQGQGQVSQNTVQGSTVQTYPQSLSPAPALPQGTLQTQTIPPDPSFPPGPPSLQPTTQQGQSQISVQSQTNVRTPGQSYPPGSVEQTTKDITPGKPECPVTPSRQISMNRQLSTASSLDEILSSSPDAKPEKSDKVLAPKVLTAQEIQHQKEDQLKNSSLKPQPKDPYKDRPKLDKFVTEVEKLAKFIEGFEKPSCSGPTPLDVAWKEVMDEQEKAGRQQKLAIARCYPMKNREQDIMPYDESRVLITSLSDDYVNASWINDLSPSCPKFIATQAPLPATLIDFWLMVYEQGVEVLVALSSDTETGKKFPQYLPTSKGETIHHGPVQLTLQSVKEKLCWTERILLLRHSETKTGRTLVHLHYNAWPVSGFPDKVSHLLQFITEVHSFYRQQRSLMKPIVVHCSNGVGRTGMFLLTYVGMQQVNHGDGIIHVPDVVAKMLWRRRNLILKKDQLKFCYEALLYYAQDVLAKEGILVHKASFGDQLPKPGVKSQSWEPGEDILFGSMSFTNLQTNVAKLGTKLDTSKLDQKLEALKNGDNNDYSDVMDGQTMAAIETVEQTTDVAMVPSFTDSSLPDVVQSPGISQEKMRIETDKSDRISGEETHIQSVEGQGQNYDLLSDLDKMMKMKIETKASSSAGSVASSQSDRSKTGSKTESLTSSPAHVSRAASHSPQTQKKLENVASSLADLQDPNTFTIGTSSTTKRKISKRDFSGDRSVPEPDPEDPLSSLDPLWTLK